MPELPEVETVRRGLEPAMVGTRFTRVTLGRPNLRFPFPERFAERLEGQEILSLSRRAKYLLADLSGGELLAMHLGMTGRFTIHEAVSGPSVSPGSFHHAAGGLASHDHVVFDLTSGTRVIYNDARRFGFMTLLARTELESHPLFRDIGVEPLGNALDGALLAKLFAGKSTPLKAALLDQRLIAGLGNIYVSEALHRAGLSPFRKAGTLAAGEARAEADRLAIAIRDVLNEAVAAGGSTLRDYQKTDGTLGYFQHAFRVYDREGAPCPTPGCGGIIARATQSGRSTFHCTICQH